MKHNDPIEQRLEQDAVERRALLGDAKLQPAHYPPRQAINAPTSSSGHRLGWALAAGLGLALAVAGWWSMNALNSSDPMGPGDPSPQMVENPKPSPLPDAPELATRDVVLPNPSEVSDTLASWPAKWSANWPKTTKLNPVIHIDPGSIISMDRTVENAAAALEKPMRDEWVAVQHDLRSATTYLRQQWASKQQDSGGEVEAVTG